LFEPIAIAVHGQDMNVMCQPIERKRCFQATSLRAGAAG